MQPPVKTCTKKTTKIIEPAPKTQDLSNDFFLRFFKKCAEKKMARTKLMKSELSFTVKQNYQPWPSTSHSEQKLQIAPIIYLCCTTQTN